MTASAEKPKSDGTPSPEVPADVLMSTVADQVTQLHNLTIELETSLSETLGVHDTLTAESFKAIQRVDYLRQSLKDISAIMALAGTNIQWLPGLEIRIDALLDIVDMRDSLGALQIDEDGENQRHEIWF